MMQTTSLLGLAVFVLANVTLSIFLHHHREHTLEVARINVGNLATAYEQHIVRAIKNIDQVLLFARSEFERDMTRFSVETIASRPYFPADITIQLALIGADGMMRASNLQSTGTIDLSDREHFRVHVGNPRDELFISKPVLGRVSKAWTIQFTRKLMDANGRFAGVLVASLDPKLLASLYQSLDLGQLGAVTLWGSDGVIRARGGASSDVIGKSVKDSELFQRASEQETGIIEAESPIDGVERITGFRHVQGYPLVVTASFGHEEVLRSFEAAKTTLHRFTLLVDVALLAIMALGAIEKYRLTTTRERLYVKARALASTLANMEEGIIMIDATGDIVALNDRTIDLLGLPQGMPLPVRYETLAARWNGAAEPEDAQTQEYALANGRIIEMRTSAIPGGGFVKTVNDITERKHHQTVLEDARDRAEAASRARTSFLATMSHEIRTPLGGILSMVDLISTTQLDPAQRRYIEITRDSAEHLLQLIDDVLDVTKLDAEHVRLENIRFDLHRQLRSTLEIVSSRAIDKGLAIVCLIAPDVPREITGDPGRLRQIVINLLGNAVKFTSRGHVLLEVSRATELTGDKLLVRVEDTGIGIPKDKVRDLFRDFSQLDTSISRRFGGTGLGLSISRKLVTRMGGSIGVTSEAGKGSTFFFEIPLLAASDAEPPPRDPGCLAIVSADAFEREMIGKQIAPAFAAVGVFAELAAATEWLHSKPPTRRRILVVDYGVIHDDGVAQTLANERARGLDAYLLCTRQDILAQDELPEHLFAGLVQKPVFLDTFVESVAPAFAKPPESVTRSPLAGLLTGLDVLLAEDNPTNQFALRRILEGMGARVTTAGNGLEALDRATAHRYDIIIMDVMMPELDGLAAARGIRKLPEPFRSTPIVALTASAFVEDREAALAAGMNSFATKPITGKGLYEAIRSCLDRDARQIEPAAAADDAPALDRHVLEQLREDLGAEHIGRALDIFLKDVAKRVEAIRHAGGDAQILRKEAHALKGSAASFGFMRLAHACAELEISARNHETDQLDALVESVLREAADAPALLQPT